MIVNAAKTKCPVLKDFWDDQYDPQTRQNRVASQDPGLFRPLERDETTANGVSTIMSDGHDEILVLDVGYQYLRNVLYVDVVRAIHDFNPCKSVSEDMTRRIWKSIIYNMNYHESEELKAEKLEEMDSPEAKGYWHDSGLKLPVSPSQEKHSRMNEHPHCKNCGQPVSRMQPFTPPSSPSSSFNETLAYVAPASIDTTQDTPGRPSCPRPDKRPISPVPPLTQTAQPFSMFTISLPAQASHQSTSGKRTDQPTPPKPSFSQTAQPSSLFTILLPRQGIRPLSSAPLPSSSQDALPPLVSSRPSWPLTSPPGQTLERGTRPTCFARPRTHRRLWVPKSAPKAFTLRTKAGDLHVHRGA